ncbi:hypothetical protein DFS34DRAFT_634945 [Phlyctochytrium arcticum]|nr:hypothetical protein DFS34DRAFT_634945 [Phlyctochytrium arcticum]
MCVGVVSFKPTRVGSVPVLLCISVDAALPTNLGSLCRKNCSLKLSQVFAQTGFIPVPDTLITRRGCTCLKV